MTPQRNQFVVQHLLLVNFFVVLILTAKQFIYFSVIEPLKLSRETQVQELSLKLLVFYFQIRRQKVSTV
jgi:hypothetical protein